MLDRDLMVRPDDGTLEKAPDAFNGVSMDDSIDPLFEPSSSR